MTTLKEKTKDIIEIIEYIEEAIPEDKKDYVDFTEVYYDRFGGEYEEANHRAYKKYILVDDFKQEVLKFESYLLKKIELYKLFDCEEQINYKLEIKEIINKFKEIFGDFEK